MIFNKEFDKSLGLILECDRSNRGKIINFLNSIPCELYEQIYIQLEKYNEYINRTIDVLDIEDFCLYGEYNREGIDNTSFVIDIIDNSITINKSLYNGKKCVDDFKLTLCSDSRFNNIALLGKQTLGSFRNYTQRVSWEYDLVNTMFGMRVLCSNNYGFKKYGKFTNSDDLSLEKLGNKGNLVKVRKIN